MHLGISQEPLYTEIYRKNAAPQSEHPDQAPAFATTVRTPQCGHTVWAHEKWIILGYLSMPKLHQCPFATTLSLPWILWALLYSACWKVTRDSCTPICGCRVQCTWVSKMPMGRFTTKNSRFQASLPKSYQEKKLVVKIDQRFGDYDIVYEGTKWRFPKTGAPPNHPF